MISLTIEADRAPTPPKSPRSNQPLTSAIFAQRNSRDKNQAHSEVQFHDGDYRFVEVKSYNLKYADVSKVLEKARRAFVMLFELVRRTYFDWDELKQMAAEDANVLWRQ